MVIVKKKPLTPFSTALEKKISKIFKSKESGTYRGDVCPDTASKASQPEAKEVKTEPESVS